MNHYLISKNARHLRVAVLPLTDASKQFLQDIGAAGTWHGSVLIVHTFIWWTLQARIRRFGLITEV